MLHKDLAHQGQWMYRWRGILPLFLVPVIIFGFQGFRYPLNSHFFDVALELICLAVASVGLAIRFVVHGYSPPGSSYIGESTKSPGTRKFKTGGMYSFCRHPLYLGNFFMGLGVLLFLNSVTVVAVYALLFFLYYERLILAEEDFLSRQFGEEYTAWARRTPLISPRFAKWEKPGYPFSWKTALRREYKRVFGVIAILTLFEVVGDFVLTGRWSIEPVWASFFFAGLTFYLSVRILKRTPLLGAPSRQERPLRDDAGR